MVNWPDTMRRRSRAGSQPRDLLCPICRLEWASDNAAEPILRHEPCGQQWHDTCITEWIDGGATSCPNCRGQITRHASLPRGPPPSPVTPPGYNLTALRMEHDQYLADSFIGPRYRISEEEEEERTHQTDLLRNDDQRWDFMSRARRSRSRSPTPVLMTDDIHRNFQPTSPNDPRLLTRSPPRFANFSQPRGRSPPRLAAERYRYREPLSDNFVYQRSYTRHNPFQQSRFYPGHFQPSRIPLTTTSSLLTSYPTQRNTRSVMPGPSVNRSLSAPTIWPLPPYLGFTAAAAALDSFNQNRRNDYISQIAGTSNTPPESADWLGRPDPQRGSGVQQVACPPRQRTLSPDESDKEIGEIE